MRIRHALFVLPLLFFAACGSSDHPLAGNWSQDTGADAKGISLEFDVRLTNGALGTEVMVHTAPAADGSHDHLHGSYTFDAASKAVTVKCKLLGDGKADSWAGTLAGDTLELAAGDAKLKFKKGGKAHGH